MSISNRYDHLRDNFGGDWKQYAEVDMAEACKAHPELALWDTANGKLLRVLSEEVKYAEQRAKDETDEEKKHELRLEARDALVQFMTVCKRCAVDRAALVKTEVERQKILGEVFTMLQMARMMNELMGIIKQVIPDSETWSQTPREVRNALGQKIQRLAIGTGDGPDGPGLSGL